MIEIPPWRKNRTSLFAVAASDDNKRKLAEALGITGATDYIVYGYRIVPFNGEHPERLVSRQQAVFEWYIATNGVKNAYGSTVPPTQMVDIILQSKTLWGDEAATLRPLSLSARQNALGIPDDRATDSESYWNGEEQESMSFATATARYGVQAARTIWALREVYDQCL